MTDNAQQLAAAGAVQPLNNETAVYRAALDETWFSSDKTVVDSAAFYRRLKRDASGLSIGTYPYAHRETELRGPIAGIISVSIGGIRDVRDAELEEPLDVVIDNPPHGNITNVPYKVKSGPRRKLADRIASLLARNAAAVHEVFDPPHN